MKRIMPLFRSKSERSTCVFGRRDNAAATFKAMVEVPTPALGEETKNLSGGIERRRLSFHQRLHSAQRVDDGLLFKGLRQKLANAGPHDLAKQIRIQVRMHRDDLHPFRLGFEQPQYLLSLVERFET